MRGHILLRAGFLSWIVAITPAGAWAQQVALSIGPSGETLAVSTSIAGTEPINIRVATPPTLAVCKKEVTPGKLQLRWLASSELYQAGPLPDGATKTDGHQNSGETVFTIDAARGTRFIRVNLVREGVDDQSVLSDCKDAADVLAEERRTAENIVKDSSRLLAELAPRLQEHKEALAGRQADQAALARQPDTGSELRAAIAAVERARAALDAALEQQRSWQAKVSEAQQTLANHNARAVDTLGAPLADVLRTLRQLAGTAVLKMAVLAIGPKAKTVYYDFRGRSPASTLGLSPLATYPLVRSGDDVFAVITNVDASAHPYPFHIAVTAQAGAAVNTEPARPVFSIPAGEAAVDALPRKEQRVLEGAWTDVILPVTGEFAPNSIPVVTIKTEVPAPDNPQKLTAVTLVDAVKFPQFRALYRYNFNTGIAWSRLEHPQWIKVRVQEDDPLTEKINEARYRTDELSRDPTVAPFFAFTVYLDPVDIQAPVSMRERLTPNPTWGLAFANPTDNVYLGFTHTILRNMQFFWGCHLGLVDELVQRNVVSEDHDSTAPATRQRREKALAFGLTFNLQVLTQIFK